MLLRRFCASKGGAFTPTDLFQHRHIGPRESELPEMLRVVGVASLDELVRRVVPASILAPPLQLVNDKVRGETGALQELRQELAENRVGRSFLGLGFHGTLTPPVIQRNLLENPGWYTAYTPYQAEIAQGRLESLFNFQTLVSELTGLPVANASLLDEATAAAEAMNMVYAYHKRRRPSFFVSDRVHPHTIAHLRMRATLTGVALTVGPLASFRPTDATCGALLQYPDTDGAVADPSAVISALHDAGALAVVLSDPLALVALRAPGALGADICCGSSQRFGVPMMFGGPHAAFFAVSERLKRLIPGRVIGLSRDRLGAPAYRMSLQTREQHIRRDRATSNICTAQALLANAAAMYAVYHGPRGLQRIADAVHARARVLHAGLAAGGARVDAGAFFDAVRVRVPDAHAVVRAGDARDLHVRALDATTCLVNVDETTTAEDVRALWELFGVRAEVADVEARVAGGSALGALARGAGERERFLRQEVFNSFHSETELMRYMYRLQAKDVGLNTSMIPLGSCTMKLNAAAELMPVTWPEVAGMHPFAPLHTHARGFAKILRELEGNIARFTGFPHASLQPNSGAQGELTGLVCIRRYHESRGQGARDVCLIPASAHGTNPASAVLAGMRVVEVECDRAGNIDVAHLRRMAAEHAHELSCLMITYPSTHGVYEESIREIVDAVHAAGGQVYMDGANMNAQGGITSPGHIGADVCHINNHKTLAIPHGGGGPGVGAIGVAAHLRPFLPNSPLVPDADMGLPGGGKSMGPMAAAPFGSAGIHPITLQYFRMLGAAGARSATEHAILNANYLAALVSRDYKVLYRGKYGFNAHEFIVDLRHLKVVQPEDVAKRIIDYGFHAPTFAFPVSGTLMIEPTESEGKAELDRFAEAMRLIAQEIKEVEEGRADPHDNVLANAPHPLRDVAGDTWNHPYSREKAGYPAPWLRVHKVWPAVARVDNVYGDKNLIVRWP